MSDTILYTDAGCRKDLSLGSYAYYVDDSLKGSGSLKGRVSPTSCELLAVLIGLKRLKKLGYTEVIVKTDSQYVAGIMNNRAHWLSIPRDEKSHSRMVMRLYRAIEEMEVEAIWIPENSEHGNEVAHRIASARLREVKGCTSIS